MKRLLVSLFLLGSIAANANGLQDAIDELQSGDVSLSTIAALIALDQKELNVGYGLCEAAGQSLCKSDGSLGYGLCEVADGMLCKKNGSLGYGLCTLSGAKNCRTNGSVGYGMCMLAGEKNCKS